MTQFDEQFQIFLGAALLLLLVEAMVPDRRRRAGDVGGEVLMRPCVWTAMPVLWFLILPSAVAGQRGRAEVNEGNRLYEEGRYEEAHEKYLEALRNAPDLPLALFNDGSALYRAEQYERARDAYRRAIESGDSALTGPAWYNLGNSLYRGQDLERSLEAYKKALRLNPDEVDYKHNLERVLEQIQQQQEQQDQQQRLRRPRPGATPTTRTRTSQEESRDGQPPEEPQPEQEPPQGASGEMSEEEAERLLQAVQEDPEDVNRRPAVPVQGRRPRNPW